jgi:hypothetical protein
MPEFAVNSQLDPAQGQQTEATLPSFPT